MKNTSKAQIQALRKQLAEAQETQSIRFTSLTPGVPDLVIVYAGHRVVERYFVNADGKRIAAPTSAVQPQQRVSAMPKAPAPEEEPRSAFSSPPSPARRRR